MNEIDLIRSFESIKRDLRLVQVGFISWSGDDYGELKIRIDSCIFDSNIALQIAKKARLLTEQISAIKTAHDMETKATISFDIDKRTVTISSLHDDTWKVKAEGLHKDVCKLIEQYVRDAPSHISTKNILEAKIFSTLFGVRRDMDEKLSYLDETLMGIKEAVEQEYEVKPLALQAFVVKTDLHSAFDYIKGKEALDFNVKTSI